jgi:ParB family transcriptional regulator, chromosome partitioning protein
VDLELHQLELPHADLRIDDPGRRRRLTASLAELGQQVPVVVVAAAGAARFVLIDGSQRVAVLRRLGRDTGAATAWPVDEAEALIQRHHFAGVSRSVLEEAWLLARRHGERGLALDALAQRFCRSQSWVSRRLALLGALPDALPARVRAGAIPPQAAMQYLVPLARANRRHCEQLLAVLGETRLSVREVGALYTGYRRADPAGRERLVADPQLFLRTQRAAAPDVVHGEDPGVALGKDLAALRGIAWRAAQRVGQGALGAAAPARRPPLASAWRAAEAAFAALREAMQEAWPDARSDHPDGDSPPA